MKAIILAGGLGTRLGNLTESIPKPMVKIDNKPILYHIMSSFSKHGINDFVIALGYKSEVIKDYFLNFRERNSNFNINIKSGKTEYYDEVLNNWNVSLVDTGIDTMTGGRVKRIQEYVKDEDDFLLTYGDGLCNVKIDELIKFHKSHKKIATVTAVRPNARFGELVIDNDSVKSFKEKPQTDKGRINGGFFVFNKRVFDFIENDKSVLEAEPLEKITSQGELKAFKHDGFWQCMDTQRDKEFLENISQTTDKYPWLK
tara:strand:+ start:477 stop:1247 length:771 start_codon:yes stop_codon:yes gene_type:complete